MPNMSPSTISGGTEQNWKFKISKLIVYEIHKYYQTHVYSVTKGKMNSEYRLCIYTLPNFRVCARRKVPSSETLQNLQYFIHKKIQSCFFHFSFRAILY